MTPKLLLLRTREPVGQHFVARLEQPRAVALGSRLAMSDKPTFGIVWEVDRIVKGTRGIIARVEKLVLCEDGSYSVEATAFC